MLWRWGKHNGHGEFFILARSIAPRLAPESSAANMSDETDSLPRVEVSGLDESDEVAVKECSFATKQDTEGVEIPMQSLEHRSQDGEKLVDGEKGVLHTESLCEIEYPTAAEAAGCARQVRAPNHAPWRCSNLALPLHYLFAGAVQNISVGLLYCVLMGTMAVDGHVYISSRIFVLAPWALKPVFGFFSDCFPVCGFHRKPYCIVGWWLVVCAYGLLVLLFEDPAVPKYCIDTGHGDLGNYVVAAGICNPAADAAAWLFTGLMALAVFGLMIAEGAAGGLLLECAQSWATASKRGDIMLQQLILRMLGAIVGSSFLALGFNGRKHLGFFDWEMPLWGISVVTAGAGAIMVVLWQTLSDSDIPETMRQRACGRGCCCCCCLDLGTQYSHCTESVDHTNHPNQLYNITGSRCRTAMALLGKIATILCTPVFAKFCLFEFTFPVFAYITPPSLDMVKRYTPRVEVQQLQQQFTDIICYLLFVLFLAVLQRPLLRFSWRCLTGVITCLGVLGVCVVCALTLFDVLRSQYFYLLHEWFAQMPRGYNYLVATLVTAELAPPGMEACVYGVISAAHSIAPLVGRAAGNAIYAHLPPLYTDMPLGALSSAENYLHDTELFRMTAMLAVFTFGFLCVVSLVLLPLLPVPPIMHIVPTKRGSTQSSHNRVRCVLMAVGVPVLFLAATFGTAMAIMPHSSCDTAVGGNGC